MKSKTLAALAAFSTLAGVGATTAMNASAASYSVGSNVSSAYSPVDDGAITGPQVAITAHGHTGYIQQTQKSLLVSSYYGTYSIRGSYKTQYGSSSSVYSYGWPTMNWQKDNTGGVVQRFTKGGGATSMVIASGGAGSWRITGAVLDNFTKTGSFAKNGYPKANEVYLSRCGESMQSFTKTSTLYQDGRWCPTTNYYQPSQSAHPAGSGYNLGSGYNGTAVWMVQKRLGIASGPMSTSIGPTTLAKIKSFQSANGLSATGVVTPTTWSRMGISYPFSTSTWAKPADVSTNASAAQRRQAIVNYVQAQRGKPYVWGGTGNTGTPLGFDCSGLALQAMRSAGVNPTNTSNWFDVYPTSDLSRKMWADPKVQRVSMSNLIPGDFVFYGDSARVRHVAIYIGNGLATQAVGSKVQTLSVWNTSGWGKIYGAQRPIASTGASSSGIQMGGMDVVPEAPKTVGADPTLVIAGLAFSPDKAAVSNGKLSASSTQGSGNGVIADVTEGSKVTVPASSDSKTVWIGSNGYVVGTSTGSNVAAPKGAAKMFVAPSEKISTIGVDAKVG